MNDDKETSQKPDPAVPRSEPAPTVVPPPFPVQFAATSDIWMAVVALRDSADRHDIRADKVDGFSATHHRGVARDLRRIAGLLAKASPLAKAPAGTPDAAIPRLEKVAPKKVAPKKARAVVRQGARNAKKK